MLFVFLNSFNAFTCTLFIHSTVFIKTLHMCGTAGIFHKYMAGYAIIMKIEMYNVTMNVLNPNVMY